MFKLRLQSLAVLFLLFSFQVSLSQSSSRQIVNQPLEWFSMSSNMKMSKRLSVYAEGQFRYVSNLQPQQFQARTALDIKVNDHFTLTPIGYVYTWNSKYGKQPAAFANNEHRIWEQVVYKHKISRVNFSHRLRLEQRFIQVHTNADDGSLVDQGYDNRQNRLRYRFMATVPIAHAKIEAKTFFASVYDEAFVSWGNNITYHKPDQNRLYAGLGYQATTVFSIQAGCLYQMLVKSNGAKQENNVGIQVQATYNLDFTKK
jgi:hypothetical protein